MNESVEAVSRWAKSAFPPAVQTVLRLRSDAIDPPAPPRQRRQREFAAGRACAMTLLNLWNVNEEVGVADDRSPIWPNGFAGSISHSDNWIWATVAQSTDTPSVGIDTEVIVSSKTRNLLYDNIATEAERAIVQSLGLSPEVTFTLAFSAKEAFYKCWYPITGEFFGFKQATIQACTASTIRIKSSVANPNFKLTPNWLDIHYLATEHDVFTATWMEHQG